MPATATKKKKELAILDEPETLAEGEIPGEAKDQLEAILERFNAQRDAEAELAEAVEEVKAAKAKLKAANDAMKRILDETQNPLPLFASQNAGVEADDEAEWRETLIEHALQGISGTLIANIQDKGLKTLGQWTDWISDDRHRVEDIAGIGAGNAEKIGAAFEAFWERRAKRKEREAAAEREMEANLARTGNAEWAGEEDAE